MSWEEKRAIREKRKSLNPEIYGDLPVLADWPKGESDMSPKKKSNPQKDDKEEDLNTILTRIKEQTSEMKRKSLARQSVPRRNESPVKVEAVMPVVPQVTGALAKPNDGNRHTDINPFAPAPKPGYQIGVDTTPKRKLFSPSRSPERKIVDVPSLPTLDPSTLPGLFKTPRNRQQVPQTPALKSIRDLFKLRETEPKLETPNVQAASQFILKLEEEVAEVADTCEVDNLLQETAGGNIARENVAQRPSEDMEVEEDPKEIVPQTRRSALPQKDSQPQDLPQPIRRTRSAKSATDPSDEGTDTKEIIPAKGRAGRVLRSAEVTSDEMQWVGASKPKRARRRAAQQSSDLSVRPYGC